MAVERAQLERRERLVLAPYAQFSSESRGRQYSEAPPEWRTHYQRDRDRIIHSRAFRRLEYKTQVFLNGSGDHYRTRLTHTIEVAGIARNIARALGLNEDLAEAIALAHDLGHSPFGHKGESVLDELMREHGGFEHNRHSLRIVEELEQKYPSFPGLNLSWEVREGLLKHQRNSTFPEARNPSLEAQVANLADEIAYYSHDLDDGLEADLLDERALTVEVRVWRLAHECVRATYGNLSDECRRYYTIRCIIDDEVRDVIFTSEMAIKNGAIHTADDARRHEARLIQYSAERRKLNLELRKYLYNQFYFHPVVHEPNLRATRLMRELFEFLIANPDVLSAGDQARFQAVGVHRTVCDHLAGMTDHYVINEHKRLLGSPPV
jgi:dGTPase